MRLLIFIFSMGSGGAERVAANMANYWAEKGWEVNLVTLTEESSDFYTLHPAINRIAFGLTGESDTIVAGLWNNIKRVSSLRRLLRRLEPDVALGMMTTANIVLALAALGMPKTMLRVGSEHIHPPQMPLTWFWETLRRHTYGLLDCVSALTTETKSWLVENTNAKKIIIIPNATTFPLSDHEPRLQPDRWRNEHNRLLLTVGRLEAQKGFDMLIDAFSRLADKHPEWRMVILGEGSKRGQLEAQVLETKLSERVFLPGRAGNMTEWYQCADLYVMSSRFEGFGNTLVEAMAHGVASISFACDTGPSDIISHNKDGYLVPSGDVAALAEAMDKLIGDEALRSRLAEKGQNIAKRFSMEKIMGLWEQAFASNRA